MSSETQKTRLDAVSTGSKRLGIIAGTVFFGRIWFQDLVPADIETPHGSCRVYADDRLVFIPRHGVDGHTYIMPHRIPHAANLSAMERLEVDGVVAVNSTGSLRRTLPPGSVLVPDDFISLFNVPTVFTGAGEHIAPSLDPNLRAALIQSGAELGIPVLDGGAYWQNTGPRLETRAEIRLMSHFADVVGMTLGSEATVAAELKIPYAAICSVDNYAHGVTDAPLSEAIIREGAAHNAETVARILHRLLEIRASRNSDPE